MPFLHITNHGSVGGAPDSYYQLLTGACGSVLAGSGLFQAKPFVILLGQSLVPGRRLPGPYSVRQSCPPTLLPFALEEDLAIDPSPERIVIKHYARSGPQPVSVVV